MGRQSGRVNIGDLRQDYRSGELHREDLAEDPFTQFEQWFQVALTTPVLAEPNAMTLATADSDGRVTARTVLLKAWDNKGFVFFTNYQSEKGRQIEANPQVALLFAWVALERQVSICGLAEKISRAETQAYFSSRPLASRVGAVASPQSQVVASRKILENKFAELEKQFADEDVPAPEHWGGYRVVPRTVEYWQGRSSRLHDRFLYSLREDQTWKIERLAP